MDMARNVRLWTPSYAAPTVGGKRVLCVRVEGSERYTTGEGYSSTNLL